MISGRDSWPARSSAPSAANLSGLIDHARHSKSGVGRLGMLGPPRVAFVIWEGNRRLYFRLPRPQDLGRYDPGAGSARPWAVIGLYTIPVAAALLWILARRDRGRRDTPA